jgi:hypothetical protein
MTATLTNATGESVSIENPVSFTVDVAPEGEHCPGFTIEIKGGVVTIDDCLTITGNDKILFVYPKFLTEIPLQWEIQGDFSGSTYPEAKPCSH